MQKWLISTHEENGSEKRESSGKVGVGQRKQLLLALCKLARFELLIAAPDHRKKKTKTKLPPQSMFTIIQMQEGADENGGRW